MTRSSLALELVSSSKRGMSVVMMSFYWVIDGISHPTGPTRSSPSSRGTLRDHVNKSIFSPRYEKEGCTR